MLPPPITSATSSPSARTSTSSRASPSTVAASRPYSRGPIRASPESFSRTRSKPTPALRDGVPGVVEELDAALLQVLRHGARRLVGAVPGLLGQDRLAEEPLVELSLDDLLADVLGLRQDLLRVREDLPLRVDELLRDLVPRAVRRPRERQVK